MDPFSIDVILTDAVIGVVLAAAASHFVSAAPTIDKDASRSSSTATNEMKKRNVWAELNDEGANFWLRRNSIFKTPVFGFLSLLTIFFSMMVMWSVQVDRVSALGSTFVIAPSLTADSVYNLRTAVHIGMHIGQSILWVIGSFTMFYALWTTPGAIMLVLAQVMGLFSDGWGLSNRADPDSTVYIALASTDIAIKAVVLLTIAVGYFKWYANKDGYGSTSNRAEKPFSGLARNTGSSRALSERLVERGV